MTQKNIFWFRRDLRHHDNAGLWAALSQGVPVLPVFIFDTDILQHLPTKDARVEFIHQQISTLKTYFQSHGSDLLVFHTTPQQAFEQLTTQHDIQGVYTNHDYEPYAQQRDEKIEKLLKQKNIAWHTHKDQVIYEKDEVTKADGKPYVVFTPYSKVWKAQYTGAESAAYDTDNLTDNYAPMPATPMMSLVDMGFEPTGIQIPEHDIDKDIIKTYDQTRDIPSLTNGTSRLGIHLRFGTISIRRLVGYAVKHNQTFLNELIWREFYMQILWHFPHVLQGAFKPQYDAILWSQNKEHFDTWCKGKTGYPLVDAGMRQLNETGYMHNRVRMVVASFLCKHLLLHWQWGEQYFAEKLLDFELASNNGGWQWAAGTGCDAAPYFRVFNPTAQQQKFDPDMKYIKQWVPEYGTDDYPEPMVEHKTARLLAIQTYQQTLQPQ